MPSDDTENLVGIDLGTTYSVIAHFDAHGHVKTIPNRTGEPRTPSVVYLKGDSARVGEAAKKMAGVESERVAMFVKRDMGQRYFSSEVDGRKMRPETLSAIVLRKLKLDAEKRVGPISNAVITVPAFFIDARRKATQDAGRIAGLRVLDIVNEPTAAALAYRLEGPDERVRAGRKIDMPSGQMTALVYDLGGGTFDVSVVRLALNEFKTLASGGHAQLGGKDWDDRIVSEAALRFERLFGVNPLQAQDAKVSRKNRDALLTKAEEAKVLLSEFPTAQLEYTYAGHEMSTELSQSAFNDMTRDLLIETQTQTGLVLRQTGTALGQSDFGWSDIDRVLLVGGSTKMPMVSQMLARLSGKTPDDSLDPDQVVARGAAIHAGIMASRSDVLQVGLLEEVCDELRSVGVVNVCAFGLGVAALRGGELGFSSLIKKNTQLPAAKSKMYRLAEGSASKLDIHVFEGDSRELRDNTKVGSWAVKNFSNHLPAGAPMQVRLEYAANGRIGVTVLDMTTGRFVKTDMQLRAGLTEDEICQESEFVQNLEIR
jgi:molecular chaperone DnaK